MTKNTTIVFDEAAGRSDRRPRFILTFDAAVTPIELISWEDAAHPQRWPLLSEVSGLSGTVRPNEGSADVAGITVKVTDDERMHQLVPLLPRNCRVQLKGGFAGLLEADWATLITGLLEECTLDQGLGVWSLKVNDLNFFKINSCFRTFGKTKLNGALAQAAATATVVSTDGSGAGDQAFHDPAASEINGWILINNKEICSYAAKTAVSFTGLARGQLAVCGGGSDQAHADGVEVRELLLLEGNPIDLLLKLLTSTGAGTNGAYDAWESDEGLGIPVALIDVAAFERERDRFLPTDTYRFVLKEPVSDAKGWTEKEIYRTINAYPIITGDGLISLRLYNPPFAIDPEPLSEADLSQLGPYDRGLPSVVNQIQFSYDYDIVRGEFATYRYDLDAVSINKHGLSKPWKMEARGLYTDNYAATILDLRVARVFKRYSDGAAGFSCEADFGKFKIDPGDLMSVTLPTLPDVQKGVRGVADAWMEVVSVRPDPMKGSIKMEILDTHFQGKMGMICPDDYPTYALATAEQKRRAYICDTATELMPDGDPPSLIM